MLLLSIQQPISKGDKERFISFFYLFLRYFNYVAIL